jgi:hypothetical protein
VPDGTSAKPLRETAAAVSHSIPFNPAISRISVRLSCPRTIIQQVHWLVESWGRPWGACLCSESLANCSAQSFVLGPRRSGDFLLVGLYRRNPSRPHTSKNSIGAHHHHNGCPVEVSIISSFDPGTYKLETRSTQLEDNLGRAAETTPQSPAIYNENAAWY